MPYVQLDGLQYPLEPGVTSLGAGPQARLQLRSVSEEGVFAVFEMAQDGNVILRRAGSVPVKINGLELLDQPSPLIHGDKLEILGRELIFGDDRRAGSTMYVPSISAEAGSTPRAAGERTAATGGRLVSLVDGREYEIPDDGLVIGRDPSCNVVVPSTEVSRYHATLAPGVDGYLLTDTSMNGVLVNGIRVTHAQLLGRGDVLRLGEEEFRFHADYAPPPRPLLATLEGSGSGAMRGKRFDIRTALVHVGRGEHNDIVLADESVSDTHASIQKREGERWCVVDMESTNGTYIAGKRISGLVVLEEVDELRFGGVKLTFRAATPREQMSKGTRVIAPLEPKRARRGTPTHVPAVKGPIRPAPQQYSQRTSTGTPAIVWILLTFLLAIVVFIFLT